ncbi:hypothetical protein JAAARDRAFT_34813 [Jaapia argillacea MUCL 33604]|uniref:Uncharacterized protein n=1 Tax=Jaapia argillacea MUCL 33604 TaxID=933084 RepID=A0A067Q3F0_9AGAM|nr:hypothetical protein JAAARDRAFT_34813 [Jaapia argillacea MUCL 33604]
MSQILPPCPNTEPPQASGSKSQSTLKRLTTCFIQTESSKARQRALRQKEWEAQQRRDEKSALKMTERERRVLHSSFDTVKTEFSDLDGLVWGSPPRSPVRFRLYDNPSRSPSPPPLALSELGVAPIPIPSPRSAESHPEPSSSPTSQFAILLSNADLASFSPDETIRASRGSPTRATHSYTHSPVKSLFEDRYPATKSVFEDDLEERRLVRHPPRAASEGSGWVSVTGNGKGNGNKVTGMGLKSKPSFGVGLGGTVTMSYSPPSSPTRPKGPRESMAKCSVAG